ncbi:RNA polymerase sigma factor [Leptolinea tardivitalis]|nr:sigma-70 family RNA polymerase sigma factor [Leptolinea tardivitalis]GAP21540.1 RNA polymerase sigma factor, sigma-70 family [Leptolinea tardivitalis]
MPEHISEIEENLLMEARTGDRNAYGELAGRCYSDVIRVVYRACGDTALAQDAVQEAFIRAWVKLPEFQARAPFSHWVCRIAVNVALDTLREKPQESIEDNPTMTHLAGKNLDPETAYVAREQADRVQNAIKSLPEAARTVLVFREYGQMSYDEIAATLEIPVGTVMSRLNYARSKLRELLLEECMETEREYA